MADEIAIQYVSKMMIMYHPIGIVHSKHMVSDNTPIQAVFDSSLGTIEVFEEYQEGLLDIEAFSHLILLYHFDRAQEPELIRKPFLDDKKDRGIFSIRHFNRPNPIGFSIVRLLSVHDRYLEIAEVDILDGTPILDIKPYVHQFDHRDEVMNGWVDQAQLGENKGKSITPKSLREAQK
jgi:tRNA-Thr(GGU) m(6)t(6)A37 methyltransferase TsaA